MQQKDKGEEDTEMQDFKLKSDREGESSPRGIEKASYTKQQRIRRSLPGVEERSPS